MKKYNFLSFDVGATSGRAVLASFDGVRFEMKEIYRFPNAILELHGNFYWNIYGIYEHFKKALVFCAQQDLSIDSIGIDTWGVDFGYIAADGTLLGLPRSYRDPYTVGAPEELFKEISSKDVYQCTGIQIMNFNSLFQLFAAKKENFAPFLHAQEILFIPDLLSYLLTGKRVCEYTDASTSQILNPKTRKFETSLLERIGVNPSLLRDLVQPGTRIGTLTEALARETGVGRIPVIAVAGHDTASAVTAVPAIDRHFAYLSSGTWSLMGIETEEPIISETSFKLNFTNEGGIEGTTRFLKNITGMWLLEQCRKVWAKEGKDYSYKQIEDMARRTIGFSSLVNPDDPSFANPDNMVLSIQKYCRETHQLVPESDDQIISCIYHSLANRYKEILSQLQEMSPFKIEKLHIIGGGSLNNLMNQLTANAIGLPVVAGPSEATAIGNAMIQAKAAGLLKDRWEIRKVIADAFSVQTIYPQK
jgi:rhamnulokinase